MRKPSLLRMQMHQRLAFCNALAYCDPAPAVFWPGCALMTLNPDIIYKTWQVLRRAEPGIGISTCCCGQPSRYLFPDKIAARQEWVQRMLEQQGVKRVYTACPNCGKELREWAGVDVISIWPKLVAYLRQDEIRGAKTGISYVLHDPCPLRNAPLELKAVRLLCSMSGAAITEPVHSGVHTTCCGNYHMLHSLEPEKSTKLRQMRIAEFSAELPVVSCCEGCLDSFRLEGLETVHLLELIFGHGQKRSWGNRILLSLFLKKKVSIC